MNPLELKAGDVVEITTANGKAFKGEFKNFMVVAGIPCMIVETIGLAEIETNWIPMTAATSIQRKTKVATLKPIN